jgi:hypothetical protein
MHAGGQHIPTQSCFFFHPRLNVALLALGKELAKVQVVMAGGSVEHMPGMHSSVYLGALSVVCIS